MRMIQKARARHEREAWQKARQMAMALTSEMNVSIITGLFLFFGNIRFFFDRGAASGGFSPDGDRGGEAKVVVGCGLHCHLLSRLHQGRVAGRR